MASGLDSGSTLPPAHPFWGLEDQGTMGNGTRKKDAKKKKQGNEEAMRDGMLKGGEEGKGGGAGEGESSVGGPVEMDCEESSSSSETELDHGKRVREGTGRLHESIPGPTGPSLNLTQEGVAGGEGPVQNREGQNQSSGAPRSSRDQEGVTQGVQNRAGLVQNIEGPNQSKVAPRGSHEGSGLSQSQRWSRGQGSPFQVDILIEGGGTPLNRYEVARSVERQVGRVDSVVGLEAHKWRVVCRSVEQVNQVCALVKVVERAVKTEARVRAPRERGVLARFDLDIPEQILMEDFPNLKKVERMKVRRNGVLVPSECLLLEFEGELPTEIRITGLGRRPIRKYVPIPLRCFKCQKFGHIERLCKSVRRCAKCGGEHKASECSGREEKCVNCGEAHRVESRECQVNVMQREVQRIKTLEGVSYAQALLRASTGDGVAPAVAVGRSGPSIRRADASFEGRSEVEFPPLVGGEPSSRRVGSVASESVRLGVARSPLGGEGPSSRQMGSGEKEGPGQRAELRAELQAERGDDLEAVVQAKVKSASVSIRKVMVAEIKDLSERVDRSCVEVRERIEGFRRDNAEDGARVQAHLEESLDNLREEVMANLKTHEDRVRNWMDDHEARLQARMEEHEARLETWLRATVEDLVAKRGSCSQRSRSRSRSRGPCCHPRGGSSQEVRMAGRGQEACRGQEGGGASGGQARSSSGGREPQRVGSTGVAGVGASSDKDGV